MNRKISKGMFVKIHPEIYKKKIPPVLYNKINYTFINRIKNSPLKVIELCYKRAQDSSFYNFLINSDTQEMIRFRTQFNINSILINRNGYQYILMARIESENELRFQLPVCFLIESSDVPLSIY